MFLSLYETSSTSGTIFSITDKNVFYRKKNNISESANQPGGMTQGVVQYENLFPNFHSRYSAFPNSKIYLSKVRGSLLVYS